MKNIILSIVLWILVVSTAWAQNPTSIYNDDGSITILPAGQHAGKLTIRSAAGSINPTFNNLTVTNTATIKLLILENCTNSFLWSTNVIMSGNIVMNTNDITMAKYVDMTESGGLKWNNTLKIYDSGGILSLADGLVRVSRPSDGIPLFQVNGTNGNVVASGDITLTNGIYYGNGSGLTGLNIPTGVAYLASNQTFTANNGFEGLLYSTNLSGRTNVVIANSGAGTAGLYNPLIVEALKSGTGVTNHAIRAYSLAGQLGSFAVNTDGPIRVRGHTGNAQILSLVNSSGAEGLSIQGRAETAGVSIRTGIDSTLIATTDNNGQITFGSNVSQAPIGKLSVLGVAATATANYGVVNIGAGGFAGGATNFVGSAQGTLFAINSMSNATLALAPSLLDVQYGGSSKFLVTGTNTVIRGGSNGGFLFGDNGGTSGGRLYSAGTTPSASNFGLDVSASNGSTILNAASAGVNSSVYLSINAANKQRVSASGVGVGNVVAISPCTFQAYNTNSATATFGLVSIGNIEFAGGTSQFAGSAAGTMIAVNSSNAFTGNMLDVQHNGTSRMAVSSNGVLFLNGGTFHDGPIGSTPLVFGNTTPTAGGYKIMRIAQGTVTNLAILNYNGTAWATNTIFTYNPTGI